MRIAIVDDEKTCRISIGRLVEELLENQACMLDYYELGEAFLESQQVYDIVIMDIELAGMNGFEASRRYKLAYPDSVIIILTTHSELMEYGYMVNVFRYIDKKRIHEKLPEAIQSALNLLQRYETVDFAIKGYGEVNLPIRNIIYIETLNRNAIIHTARDSFICTEKMDDIESRLENKGFFRCHRGVMISLDNVIEYNNYAIKMSNEDVVMMSVRKVKPFKDAYIKRKFEYANS